MEEAQEGDYFVRCTESMRYQAPRELVQALASCPPGWHTHVREIYRRVEEVKGTVWDCEPKFARLDLGLALPDDVSPQIVQAINTHAAAAAVTCEACGGPGTLRDARSWWRVLCDECVLEVNAHGWWDVYQRYRTAEPSAKPQ